MKRPKSSEYLLGPVATEFYNIPTGKWKNMRPVIIQSECKRCKQCIVFCPCDVIHEGSGIDEKIKIQYEFCKGCGICANVCINGCILMEKDEKQNET